MHRVFLARNNLVLQLALSQLDNCAPLLDNKWQPHHNCTVLGKQ